MLTDEKLEKLKNEYLQFGSPSWKDAVELIDEIRRLRTQNSQLRTWLDGAIRVVRAASSFKDFLVHCNCDDEDDCRCGFMAMKEALKEIDS